MRSRTIVLLAVLASLLTAAVAMAAINRRERASFLQADIDRLAGNAQLSRKAIDKGRTVFQASCASCHGADARGSTATGVPNLTDQDFLYGSGRASEIEQIVMHGIRSGDDKGWDLASMPAFAQAVPYARERLPSLTPAQIDQLTSYVRAMNGAPDVNPGAVSAGHDLFVNSAGCWDCHGRDAHGDPSIGAPNLTDSVWLRGDGSARDVSRIIREGLHGVSPAFRGRLDPVSIRSVAIYVASLHTQKEAR